MQMQGQQQWAAAPGQGMAPPANCPPGLEYLLHVDQLLIKQQVELLEAFTGFETANKYKVRSLLILFAKIDINSLLNNNVGFEQHGSASVLRGGEKRLLHSSVLWPASLLRNGDHRQPGDRGGSLHSPLQMHRPMLHLLLPLSATRDGNHRRRTSDWLYPAKVGRVQPHLQNL